MLQITTITNPFLSSSEGMPAMMIPLLVALSAPTASGLALPDALCGSRWKVSLNIGREPGTWMPEDWASSGARLLLPLEVRFDAEDEPSVSERIIGGSARRLTVLSEPSFVGAAGEVKVACAGGAWCLTPSEAGEEGALRFCLDFPEESRRNDVTLPPGRVFFTTAAWQGDALERKLAERAEVEEKVRLTEASYVEAEKASREGSLWDRLSSFRSGVDKFDKRTAARAELGKFAMLPRRLDDTTGAPGGVRVAERGGLSVKRIKMVREEYHILGRFSMAPAVTSDSVISD